MKNKVEIDVRAYPLDSAEGSTRAFASAAIKVNGEDMAAIRGIRVVDGQNGLFVSMPQSKSEKDGQPPAFHDIAYAKGELANELKTAVLAEYAKTLSAEYQPKQNEQDENGAAAQPPQASGRIKMVAFITPLGDSESNTKAFANVLFKADGENLAVINGIRVVDGQKGIFVTMPQQRKVDKDNGEVSYHDVAFPLTKRLRDSLNKTVLAEYARTMSTERKQSFGDRLEEGKEKSARQSAEQPARQAAKAKPGVRD